MRYFERLYSSTLSPRFNLFRSLINPNEMMLSKMLGFILDPQETHAQGVYFLEGFIDRFIGIENNFVAKNVKIMLEAPASNIENNQRRMDIDIDLGGGVSFAIENKPWASDQPEQMNDYYRHILIRYPHKRRIIYLSGGGWEPGSHSADKDLMGDDYVHITYHDLSEWLEESARGCRAERVRYFVSEFSAYCKQEFVGGDSMHEVDLVKEVCESPENLESALMVSRHIEEVKADLFDRFFQDFKSMVETNLGGYEVIVTKHQKHEGSIVQDRIRYFETKWVAIRVKKNSWTKYSISIEFDANRAANLAIGVQKISHKGDVDYPSPPDFSDEDTASIKSKLGGSWSRSKWWPLYRIYDEDYRDWSRSISPWLEIKNKKLAERLFEDVRRLLDAASDIIDKYER